jgi:phosphatidylglycerol:prolipoprotein diacylglycerol transferase
LPAGVLSARLVHVLGWWDYYLTHGAEVWQLNVDGLALWGGLVGGGAIAFARLRSRRDRLRRRRILDAVVPYVALGMAIAGLGAFLDGHGQGQASDLPWATLYAHPLAATPDFGVPRHPAQVYDALVALGLCALLLRLPRWLMAGSRLAVFLVLFGAARVALGPVRLDPSFLFGWQIEQLLALAGIAFGLVYGLGPLVAGQRSRLAASAGQGPPRPTPTGDSLAA